MVKSYNCNFVDVEKKPENLEMLNFTKMDQQLKTRTLNPVKDREGHYTPPRAPP